MVHSTHPVVHSTHPVVHSTLGQCVHEWVNVRPYIHCNIHCNIYTVYIQYIYTVYIVYITVYIYSIYTVYITGTLFTIYLPYTLDPTHNLRTTTTSGAQQPQDHNNLRSTTTSGPHNLRSTTTSGPHNLRSTTTSGAPPHLGEHGLAVLRHHGALVAVQGHKVVVERLLGVLQDVVQLSGAPFKYTPEVPRNQRPANG